MKAAEIKFLPFLEGKKQFIIPIYQRTYSWTREQCEQLWNDIVRSAKDDEIKGHFVGSIVYIQKDIYHVAAIQELLVIDGQQRLTTLSLLLAALANVANKSTSELNINSEEINDSYLINKHAKDELHYKLMLTQSDKETLMSIIDGRDVPKPPSQSIMDSYRYFEEQIRQSGINPQTLYIGLSKLIIVDIALTQGQDNPQLIFESLNSTGMDLSQADLIRNYVLMGLDNEDQDRLYKYYWYPMEQSFRHTDGSYQFDRFMRDYLTFKQGSIPNIDEVYISFKSFQRSKMAISIGDIVSDIYRYSRYFVNMAFLREEDREIRSVLSDINTLRVDVAYPFLLEVYDDYANHRLSREDFIAILKLVESYVFRRVICGVPTNSMNKTFATLAKEIDKEYYLESVQVALLLKDSYRRFPKDEEFRAAFVVKDVYNFRSRNYLLRKLENYGHKELVNVESCTIEHIMPQNKQLSIEWQEELGPNWQGIHATYLHTIGNLTLTGYNSELSDHTFQEKRDREGGFARSPIRLNSSLARLENWNKEEIERRAESLAELAVKVWPISQLSPEQISKYSKQVGEIPSELIGPIEYPVVGFIPRGFKVVQISGNRFHLFKLIGNEWIQYGNGKKPWYAISWKNAGMWARDKQNKSEMPLGVGGTEVYPLPTTKAESGVLVENGHGDDTTGSNGYSVDDYPALQGDMREVFEHLRKRILNLDSSVREEYKKLYIAYKTTTNFVDIVPQVKRLRLSLNMKFNEIEDPKGLCKDITELGRWGNGDVEVGISSLDQIDDVMDLVRQSFERHWEEVYA